MVKMVSELLYLNPVVSMKPRELIFSSSNIEKKLYFKRKTDIV